MERIAELEVRLDKLEALVCKTGVAGGSRRNPGSSTAEQARELHRLRAEGRKLKDLARERGRSERHLRHLIALAKAGDGVLESVERLAIPEKVVRPFLLMGLHGARLREGGPGLPR